MTMGDDHEHDIRTPAAEGGRARTGGALIATVKTWWMAYLTWRFEQLAIAQLEAMSERELEDIGLTHSQIEWAVRGCRASAPAAVNRSSLSNGMVPPPQALGQ
jgi:uncharacterized protein YjiS (DUF1127 family)